jgi:hypothetical protein
MNLSNLSYRSHICLILLLALALGHISTMRTRAQPTSVTPTTLSKPDLVKQYQQSITAAKLASRLYFLASDFFEGRETSTRGQKLAAQYLASQYRLMGLEPKGTQKNADPLSPAAYFQPFNVYRQTPNSTKLELTVAGRTVASSTFSADAHDDLSYFLRGNLANVSGGVVFAGYGIADEQWATTTMPP